MKYGIEENIYNNILNVFKKYNSIKKVYLFGSRARGNYKKVSDIDLAVISEDDIILKLLRELDELRCILKFDVVDFNNISEKLKQNIEKDKICIYENR